MIKKGLLAISSLVAGLLAFGLIMYILNPAPTVPAIAAAEAANPAKPYVVKLHAQWCPVCMVTKGMWSQIEGLGYVRGCESCRFCDFTDPERTLTRAAPKRNDWDSRSSSMNMPGPLARLWFWMACT